MTKPPSSIRLCVTNCSSSSAMAGPEYAVHPSRSRKRRWRSRGSSASRLFSASRNCARSCSDFTGSSILKARLAPQPGSDSLRSSPDSTMSLASRATTSGETGIGSGAVVSTGEPKVISESMSAPRR